MSSVYITVAIFRVSEGHTGCCSECATFTLRIFNYTELHVLWYFLPDSKLNIIFFYYLTTCSRVLVRLTVAQLVKKFPTLNGT